MKRIYPFIALIAISLSAFAWTSPVAIPDVGNARLRIVGQNAANYLTDFTASNSSCEDQAEFDAKTNKMANAFIALQADIVAICEVERNDQVLGYICNAMNTISNTNVWTYITDGLYASQSSSGYMPLKAGYIYRSDKVTPYGNNTSPYSSGEYRARMRIQAFKENATNEIFVLSMNHFKAKDSSADQAESVRLENVSYLLTALNKITSDPDILIMGDLNSYTNEAPIQNLVNAGYEEQLVRFDANAYTYIYKGQRGILDHALANSTMAQQITGAYAYHINNAGGYNYKYSDHDAVLVGLRLGEEVSGCETIDITVPARKILRDGKLYIELNGELYDILGHHISNTNSLYR